VDVPERAGRVRRILADTPEADAVLVTSPANVAYLLGHELASDAIYGSTMGGTWVLAARSGELRVIAASIDLPVIIAVVAPDAVFAHDGYLFPQAPADHPLNRIERLGRGPALRRGLDALGVSGGVLADQAVSELDGARADPEAFLRARAIKGPEEVEQLREVNRIAEEALHEALDHARPGQTERELAGALYAAILARGAYPRLCIVGFGERGAIPQDYPSDRRLAVGDSIRIDVNCTLRGYNADLARTAVLGPPSPALAGAYEGILAGADAAAGAIEPGVEAGALWRRASEGAQGLGPYERRHFGHGIGLEVYEPPILQRGNPTPLAEGMVVCVETLWLVPGEMGLQIEDAYVVARDGPSRLAVGSRELIVLDP